LRRGFDEATLDAPLRHGRVFAGIVELLEHGAATRPLAVFTNKPTALARRMLGAAGCRAAWAGWGYGLWPDDAPPGTWRLAGPAELQARLA
jgi:phosphoglycolate phosphatase-like HAD superfamily hydrolase